MPKKQLRVLKFIISNFNESAWMRFVVSILGGAGEKYIISILQEKHMFVSIFYK